MGLVPWSNDTHMQIELHTHTMPPTNNGGIVSQSCSVWGCVPSTYYQPWRRGCISWSFARFAVAACSHITLVGVGVVGHPHSKFTSVLLLCQQWDHMKHCFSFSANWERKQDYFQLLLWYKDTCNYKPFKKLFGQAVETIYMRLDLIYFITKLQIKEICNSWFFFSSTHLVYL